MKQYIVMARGDDGWLEPHICEDYEAASRKVYDLYTGILKVNVEDDPDDEYSIERLNDLNEKTNGGKSIYTVEIISRQIGVDIPDGVWFEVYVVHNNQPGFRVQ